MGSGVGCGAGYPVRSSTQRQGQAAALGPQCWGSTPRLLAVLRGQVHAGQQWQQQQQVGRVLALVHPWCVPRGA
jgi:hypothetical protein